MRRQSQHGTGDQPALGNRLVVDGDAIVVEVAHKPVAVLESQGTMCLRDRHVRQDHIAVRISAQVEFVVQQRDRLPAVRGLQEREGRTVEVRWIGLAGAYLDAPRLLLWDRSDGSVELRQQLWRGGRMIFRGRLAGRVLQVELDRSDIDDAQSWNPGALDFLAIHADAAATPQVLDEPVAVAKLHQAMIG